MGDKSTQAKGEEEGEENKVIVAFQGESGAYSAAATLQLLGENVKPTGYESFEKCFRAVEEGEAQFACLPIENSLGGTIHENYDLQLKHRFFIVGELDFRVRHCLMVRPGVQEHEIEKVLSHPQALAQCDSYLRSKNLVGEQAYDTAGSAKMIADDDKLKNCAAIASSLAAQHYGLEILDEGIEDDDKNFTRFLLICKRWLPLQKNPPKVEWKTTMVFSLINYPGVLVKALSAFSFRDVNLTKLESRPDKLRLKGRQLVLREDSDEQQIPIEDRQLLDRLQFPEILHLEMENQQQDQQQQQQQQQKDEKTQMSATTTSNAPKDPRFQVIFYVDCTGSLADAKLQNALRHLSELATFMRVLGSYPTGGVLCDYVAQVAGVSHGAILSQTTGADKILTRTPSSTLSQSTRLKIGIIGFGNFGQFLAKTFTKYHDVYACSRSDYSQVCQKLGVHFSNSAEEMFQQSGGLDCLVISVSILSFESVVKRLPMEHLKGVLVVDVLSVKTLPKNVLQVLLPESADILCTHPMFGPESGKYSWRGLPCVYEKVRICKSQLAEKDRRCEKFLDIFRKAGCRMVDMSCEIHDEAAAGSQFVTHFTGRMLEKLNLHSTPINTKGFETLLALVDNTSKDSFDLFSALYKCNPNSSAQLQALRKAMDTLSDQLQDSATSSSFSPASKDQQQDVRVSEFVNRIKPSKTSETHALAMKLKREGKDIVTTLTVGEPDFSPPKPILDAVCYAADNGMTRYTPVGGNMDLKEAIAKDNEERKGVKYKPENIVITHGGKQAIFLAIMSLCDVGDEVIIPCPAWVSYFDITRLSGATSVFVHREAKNDYVMSPEQLEKALSPKTRLLILCNPGNPTGCNYSKEQLQALANVLSKPEYSGVYVLCDEIYERITHNMPHVSFASLSGMYERTILVSGFAKGYAMTGFRLGYLASASSKISSTGLKLQSQLNSCASSLSQYAGVAALRDVTEEMLKPLYDQLTVKRDVIVQGLQEIPHIICPTPKGAFYVFPDVSYYLGKGAKSKKTGMVVNTSTELCSYLIQEHGLALPPGDAFGAPNGVRFSYATGLDDIKQAIARFAQGINGLEL